MVQSFKIQNKSEILFKSFIIKIISINFAQSTQQTLKELPMRQQYDSQINRNSVSFYSLPNNSHAVPLLRIANYINKHSPHKVRFYTSKIFVEKVQHQFPKINFISIQDHLTEQKLQKIVKCRNVVQNYGNYFQQQWAKHFQDIENSVEQRGKPDLIVSDFNTLPAIKFAIKHEIKLIVNYPLSLSIVSLLNRLPNFKDALGLGGFTISHPGLQKSLKIPNIEKDYNVQIFDKKALFMINSFFGIDKPMVLPPNYIMTGPFINTFVNTTQSQIRSDSKVFQWMRTMKGNGKTDFIYVSFGSSSKLSQQFIKVIYEGLKKTNFPVIWSLKSQFSKLIQSQNFFIEEWLPQQKVLERQQIKVFVNHGGWNSVNEGIFHAKPMVIIPGFADQQLNAYVLHENKVAVVLSVKKSNFLPIDNSVELTSDQVRKSVRKVMSQSAFKQNALRISKIANLTNGFQIYKNTIDIALESGYSHLIDENYTKVAHKSGYDTLKILFAAASVVLLYKHNWVQKAFKDIFKH